MIEQAAQAVATTRRSIESELQRSLQVTPSAYLRQLRLQGARADLLDAGQVRSVSQIAARWGFAHPGLLSRRYHEAFGELPRETLARRP